MVENVFFWIAQRYPEDGLADVDMGSLVISRAAGYELHVRLVGDDKSDGDTIENRVLSQDLALLRTNVTVTIPPRTKRTTTCTDGRCMRPMLANTEPGLETTIRVCPTAEEATLGNEFELAWGEFFSLILGNRTYTEKLYIVMLDNRGHTHRNDLTRFVNLWEPFITETIDNDFTAHFPLRTPRINFWIEYLSLLLLPESFGMVSPSVWDYITKVLPNKIEKRGRPSGRHLALGCFLLAVGSIGWSGLYEDIMLKPLQMG